MKQPKFKIGNIVEFKDKWGDIYQGPITEFDKEFREIDDKGKFLKASRSLYYSEEEINYFENDNHHLVEKIDDETYHIIFNADRYGTKISVLKFFSYSYSAKATCIIPKYGKVGEKHNYGRLLERKLKLVRPGERVLLHKIGESVKFNLKDGNEITGKIINYITREDKNNINHLFYKIKDDQGKFWRVHEKLI